MIGHSIGEYVAACLADVFSLEDATTLVAMRGQMMDRMPQGAMLAVPLSELEAQRYLSDSLSLAAVNGPASCVLSGPIDAVDQLAEQLSKRDVHYHRLSTSHAFHSSMMDPIEGPFIKAVRTIRLKAPQIPYLSNVTGTWITAEAAMDPSYWGRQLRRTVRFTDGLEQLYKTQECILLEVGPGQVLSNLARQHPGRRARQVVLSSLPSVRNQQSDVPSLLSTLGKLWLYGVDGNWNGFYTHERCRRIPLPTCPFERQRYWIGPPEYQETLDDMAGASGKRDIADWFYYPSWKPAVPWESSTETQQESKKSRWLVFGDRDGFGSQLIQRLREHGDDVTSVIIGEKFARIDASSYAIRPQAQADYDMLLKNVRMQTDFPNTIIHLWSVTHNQRHPDALLFEQFQHLGFYSIIFLVQALEKHNVMEPIQISFVSNHVQAVIGDEALCPAKATVLGPCKVIPQEYPNIRCQIIDIDLYESDQQRENRLVERLVAELTVAPFESAVAYRKECRWIQTFEAVRLSEATEKTLRLRHQGVYLITGGLGKIGLVLAESLTRTAQAKLVLTGRSVFPKRSEWDKWLENDPAGTVSHRIRKLLQLEELGAELMTFRADAADRKQMRRVIEEAEARFGTIHGVIHAAGNTDAYSPVSQIDQATAEQQFRPKANGVIVLEELLRGRELDFFVLLSSLSSILGGLGLVAYSAANIFLDAMASQRNQEGSVPWISVNWDAWQFPDVGELDGEESASATDFILPEEGEEAFQRILARAPRQVVVSTSDLEVRFNQWIRLESVQEKPRSYIQDPAQQHARPNLTNPYIPARSAVELTLAEIWQQLLGVAPVGTFDNFFELGGHSLLAIQLISRLREAFQIEFSVHRVFEAPTITELAESIEKNRRAAEEEELKTAQLLDFVEQLSESEVRALLEQNDDSLQDQKLRDA
jgi:acyl transferase domain-containing protein/acyl carrier protein